MYAASLQAATKDAFVVTACLSSGMRIFGRGHHYF